MFIGREKEQQILSKRFQAFMEGYRQNIAFLGNERVGKSTLIREFIGSQQVPKAIFYYLHTPMMLYSECLNHFCYTVLNGFLLHEGRLSEESADIDALIRQTEQFLPETVSKIKMMLSFSETNQKTILTHILNLVDSFIRETGNTYKIVMVIDEFHTLHANFGADAYRQLAKFILSQKDVLIVLLSSSVKEAERILGTDLHLIFGNFERIYLSDFTPEESMRFLAQSGLPEAIGPMGYKFIVHLSGGNPYYLTHIVKKILSVYGRSGGSQANEEQLLFAALKELLFQEDGVFYQLFYRYIEELWKLKNRNTVLKTALLLADGYQRIPDMKLFLKNVPEIKSYLNRLVEIGVATQSGNVFGIKDPLWLLWLKYVFKTLKVYSSISPVRERLFDGQLRQEFVQFSSDLLRKNVSRVIELFTFFKGDTVYTGNKKQVKLPHIEKVRLLRTVGEAPGRCFIIGEGNDVVIASLKENRLEEADVKHFETQCVSLKSKNIRKCIVTLDAYTDAARLLAQEHGMYLWNRDDINFLLRLYNKPVLL